MLKIEHLNFIYVALNYLVWNLKGKIKKDSIKYQKNYPLSTTFSNNVLDSTKEFSLEVLDEKDMQGVPSMFKKLWSDNTLARTKRLFNRKNEGSVADIPRSRKCNTIS